MKKSSLGFLLGIIGAFLSLFALVFAFLLNHPEFSETLTTAGTGLVIVGVLTVATAVLLSAKKHRNNGR
ncbi:hypothetical protein F9C11_21955 [Amycolatopsis sp. VS8301801F10]|uniref:hypothetical protein n=1 Tax=unclassified Amycolatopsis TaxID=2618356 RepID=UPI0038FBFDD8